MLISSWGSAKKNQNMSVSRTNKTRHLPGHTRVASTVALQGDKDLQPEVGAKSYVQTDYAAIPSTKTTKVKPNNSPTRQSRSLLLGLFIMFCALPVLAGSIRVQWDSTTQGEVAGYRLYYGTESGNYASVKDVGQTSVTELAELPPGQVYYLAVSAYSSNGFESPLSDEVTQYLPSGNNPPQPTTDAVVVEEDGEAAITLTGVDPDSDPLDFTLLTSPTKGTLSGTPPNLSYRPSPNYNGTDSFEFTVSDKIAAPVKGTVSITVTPVNDAPVASALSLSVTSAVPARITLAATDLDNSVLTFTTASPAHGSLSGTAPNLTYTAFAGYTGADAFDFTVSDGSLTSTARVNITILGGNAAPTATSFSVTVKEDTATPIVLKGTDANNDALTYNVVTAPVNGTISGTAPNLTYTPKKDYSGTDSFTFTVNDGKLTSGAAKVSITVQAVNDVPVPNSKTVTVAEDTEIVFNLDAHDPDTTTSLTYKVTTAPANGTIVQSGRTIRYKGKANFNGTDYIKFTAADQSSTSPVGTVTLKVTAVNDAPVAKAATVSVVAGTSAAITLIGTDVDKDALSYSVTKYPVNGTLSGTAPSLTYKPKTGYKGTDSFQFKVSDGKLSSAVATISINVTATKTTTSEIGAVVVAQGSSVDVLGSGSGALLAHIAAAAGTTYSIKTAPEYGAAELGNDGSLNYRHFGGPELTDTFTYTKTATDGTSTDSTVDVRIFRIVALEQSGSDLNVEFSATAGLQYRVEFQDASAPTATAWQVLTTVEAPTDGIVTVTDSGAADLSVRSYRVRCLASQGEIVSEPWGYQKLALTARTPVPASPFFGAMVRSAKVTATAVNGLTLEGPAWTEGALTASAGFASHIATIVASSDSAAIGRWWPIAGNDTATITVAAGNDDLRNRVQVGDVVEVRRLITAADLFEATLAAGDVVTVLDGSSSALFAIEAAEATESAAYYVIETDGSRNGPVDASAISFNPGEWLSCRGTNVTATVIGRVPAAPVY